MIDRYGPAAVCTTLAPMLTPDRIARIDAVLSSRLGSIATAVEDTYDPHNAAATMRTSEALGLQELHVIEPGDRFSTAQGVTRGSHRWIDLHRWPNADAAKVQSIRIPAAQTGDVAFRKAQLVIADRFMKECKICVAQMEDVPAQGQTEFRRPFAVTRIGAIVFPTAVVEKVPYLSKHVKS